MGAQAMSSHQGSGGVSRQGSLCGLALSEVEGQLHGVNLDDLLRTGGGRGGGGGGGEEDSGRGVAGHTGRDGQRLPAAGGGSGRPDDARGLPVQGRRGLRERRRRRRRRRALGARAPPPRRAPRATAPRAGRRAGAGRAVPRRPGVRE
ncbi:hypothetical protein EE612_017117 [Oryza sativa]|nr:hypothetical protein EE612_017117 [Oryza sativa]